METRAQLRTQPAEQAERNSPAKKVNELPLNGRDFSTLLLLQQPAP